KRLPLFSNMHLADIFKYKVNVYPRHVARDFKNKHSCTRGASMKTFPMTTAASTSVLALLLGLTAPLVQGQTTTQETDAAEEVLVTGIRKAMEKSLDIKRSSTQVVESLDLSDINAMPDVT